MLRRIEPEVIVCYHTPFPEMEGNIAYVDYELSSWKHEDDDVGKSHTSGESIRITKHTGYVVFDKGGGSVEGGDWQPSKTEDERFLGDPGNVYNTTTKYERDTVIGKDGRAVVERHYTDHDTPNAHSDPHDHVIDWGRGFPYFIRRINYFDSDVPYLGDFLELFESDSSFDTEFSKKKEAATMRNIRLECKNTPEENRFKTISDFKWSLQYGGEIQFDWNGKGYGVFRLEKTPGSDDMFYIGEDNKEETGAWYKTIDKVLDHHILDGVKLCEIIMQVDVTSRNI